MWYLFAVIICCLAGVVGMNHCIQKKNDRLRKMQDEKSEILKLPSHSNSKTWMDAPKHITPSSAEQHDTAIRRQQELQREDEMYWFMLQNNRF